MATEAPKMSEKKGAAIVYNLLVVFKTGVFKIFTAVGEGRGHGKTFV